MRTDAERRKLESLIDEEADESFPASDPPSWSGMHIGTPCPAKDGADASGEAAAAPSARTERAG